jgi:DegV family protein with EDD domain
MLDGREFLDDMGETLPLDDMYQCMVDGAETKTSQVTVAEYLEHFEPMLQEGKDILHVAFSSGLSGSYNSACLAVEELREKYPERKIYLVDSLAASSGFGLIMETLADLRDSGMGLEELYQWIEKNKLRMQHWFFSTDLTFYIKGGRVSKTAGLVGNVLNICPLLNVDYLGRLQPREKIRGKKKVIARTVEMMEKHAQDGLDYSGKCYISYSACLDDALKVASMIEARFPNLKEQVQLYPIGATIGSHTGPGTVALFFWGDERVD